MRNWNSYRSIVLTQTSMKFLVSSTVPEVISSSNSSILSWVWSTNLVLWTTSLWKKKLVKLYFFKIIDFVTKLHTCASWDNHVEQLTKVFPWIHVWWDLCSRKIRKCKWECSRQILEPNRCSVIGAQVDQAGQFL